MIDLNRVAGLGSVAAANGAVVTGALVRQAAALADHALGGAVPLLALALPHVGHYQTRARGTLAGSVAHADPSAELPLVLATLGGEVELRAASSARRVGARAFFQGALTTARAADELVTGLIWPRRDAAAGFAFEEFARRHGDFAIVAAAALARVAEDGSIAELVLGLISTKRAELEAPDELVRRIREASRFVPSERLALSPQCGFSTSIEGSGLSLDDERRKLELLCETARRVWG